MRERQGAPFLVWGWRRANGRRNAGSLLSLSFPSGVSFLSTPWDPPVGRDLFITHRGTTQGAIPLPCPSCCRSQRQREAAPGMEQATDVESEIPGLTSACSFLGWPWASPSSYLSISFLIQRVQIPSVLTYKVLFETMLKKAEGATQIRSPFWTETVACFMGFAITLRLCHLPAVLPWTHHLSCLCFCICKMGEILFAAHRVVVKSNSFTVFILVPGTS